MDCTEGGPTPDGFMWVCDNKTERECFERNLFGTVGRDAKEIKKMGQNSVYFLFNRQKRVVYGVFRPVSPPNQNIEPDAWNTTTLRVSSKGSRFPTQARVTRVGEMSCFHVKKLPVKIRYGRLQAHDVRVLLCTYGLSATGELVVPQSLSDYSAPAPTGKTPGGQYGGNDVYDAGRDGEFGGIYDGSTVGFAGGGGVYNGNAPKPTLLMPSHFNTPGAAHAFDAPQLLTPTQMDAMSPLFTQEMSAPALGQPDFSLFSAT